MGIEFKKYGPAKMVFCDEEKRKEWEEIDPQVKKTVTSILHETTKRLTIECSLELLCNLVIDMQERIEVLESKFKEES